ncbi:MAG: helix-turn-helix domain-containing protein [Corynebacterium sp.]|uniref:PucR family transcriptional regulator n=1 Tax=Corynebacterium sp. TaxID=1720 RepID=UPI0026E00D6F|nr:helix-turn-helix domain-containing protein [Corynebacterium sp.]MDO5669932.1 helix-turn-helix domain-containing protein [Corynebacterium sp.]
MDNHSTDRWQNLLDRLQKDDESLVDTTVAQLLDTIPGYGKVGPAPLAFSVRRNIALSIRIIRHGAEPTLDDVPEAHALANERLGQGVPLGSVLSGFRVSMIMILRRLIALAPEFDVPTDEVLECSTLLWSLADAFSTRATAVYRDREIARAVADSARRSEWIGNAVREGMEASELMWGAAMYNVPTDVPLRAVAAFSTLATGAPAEPLLVAWAERSGLRLLTSVQSSIIVGILIGELREGAQQEAKQGMVIGLGQPELLSELHASFSSATLALRAAEQVGEEGLVDLENLSWRLAIHTCPEATDLLKRRYLDPLRGVGEFRTELLESVRAYLEHRMNIPAASRSIPVHVNTLRYRLRRFEELTGADLGDVQSVIEVAWVLAAHPKL